MTANCIGDHEGRVLNFTRSYTSKYEGIKDRDPATGTEGTGRGRAPLWLAGKDKEQFLIT
jgi:DNA-binding protein H-NS